MHKNGLILLNYPFINTVLKVPVGKGVTLFVFGVNVTADEVPAVGEGVKKKTRKGKMPRTLGSPLSHCF